MTKELIMNIILNTLYDNTATDEYIKSITGVTTNKLSSSSTITPIYEPMDNDIVFMTNNRFGVYDDGKIVFISKITKKETRINQTDGNTIMFGRYTDIKSTTVVKHHYKHFQKYKEVVSIIKESADNASVPYEIIATILYNESKFNNDSKSHTGVTGISMFTNSTARQWDVDKDSIESQIDGTARMLRGAFDNLPDYYSDEEKWKLSAIIYNRGKGGYWKAKSELISEGLRINYSSMIRQMGRQKYMKEGLMYVKRLNRNKVMFA